MIRENLEGMAHQADAKDIGVVFESGFEGGEADANMIHVVVRNLLSNAVKFTEEGGKIVIRTKDEGNLLVVSVEDNGIGMSEAISFGYVRAGFGCVNPRHLGRKGHRDRADSVQGAHRQTPGRLGWKVRRGRGPCFRFRFR
ncbi:MAG: ATP-binding protein [Bacteroidales bacterium]